MNFKRLNREFFQKDAYHLANALLGKVLFFNNQRYRIIETECYGGLTDKAAHSYNNKKTPRTKTMYLNGGHVYIYLIYGMYHMLNIVASIEENPEAVLIRALEPLDNNVKTKGPGVLCKSLCIDKTYNELDLCESDIMYIVDDEYIVEEIVSTKRINIDYAGEDKDRLWRFYIKNHPFISRK